MASNNSNQNSSSISFKFYPALNVLKLLSDAYLFNCPSIKFHIKLWLILHIANHFICKLLCISRQKDCGWLCCKIIICCKYWTHFWGTKYSKAGLFLISVLFNASLWNLLLCFRYLGMLKQYVFIAEDMWYCAIMPWVYWIFSSGDTVGSIIYVPCEVIKQRMQIQGVESNWVAKNSQVRASNVTEAQYYRRFSHAAVSIVEKEGLRGLFTG